MKRNTYLRVVAVLFAAVGLGWCALAWVVHALTGRV